MNDTLPQEGRPCVYLHRTLTEANCLGLGSPRVQSQQAAVATGRCMPWPASDSHERLRPGAGLKGRAAASQLNIVIGQALASTSREPGLSQAEPSLGLLGLYCQQPRLAGSARRGKANAGSDTHIRGKQVVRKAGERSCSMPTSSSTQGAKTTRNSEYTGMSLTDFVSVDTGNANC